MVREVERDCWTGGLRRSAGWRRMAERQPVVGPARKSNAVMGVRCQLFSFGSLGGRGITKWERRN